MLRVLWFTNVELDPEEIRTGRDRAKRGWMAALASTIYEQVDLHVASVHHSKRGSRHPAFSTHYLTPRFGRLRLLLRWLCNYQNVDGDLVPQILRIIDEVKPDIVHIHGSEKSFIRAVPHLNERNVPVLLSIQGILSVISKKQTAGFSESFIRTQLVDRGFGKSALLPRTLHRRHRQVRRLAKLEQQMFRYVPFFAGRTDWDRTIVSLMNPDARYFHVDRVLKEAFYGAAWAPSERVGHPVIHTTTGNSIHKGFEVIAEAAHLLERNGFRFTWQVAGLDESSWSVRATKRLLGARYPASGLVLLGTCPAPVLAERMRSADLYVSASHIENSPNNLAEAMMLGMPCIATDVGGTGSYIQHGVTGHLIPPGDPFALAGAVFDLLKQPDTLQNLGRKARAVALRRHDPERVKKSLLGAYEQIVEAKKGVSFVESDR